MTSTSTPDRASHQAVLSPVTPPPITTTSAPRLDLLAAAMSASTEDSCKLTIGADVLVGRPLAADPKPRLPLRAHCGVFLPIRQNGQRNRSHRRSIAREWHLRRLNAGRLCQRKGHLLATSSGLTHPHARPCQPLDLILINRPVFDE